MSDNGSKPATQTLDLDAFVEPPSAYTITVGGVEYPVRQLIYLSGREEADLANLERALEQATDWQAARRAAFDKAFKFLRLLCPTIPEVVLMRLRLDQALAAETQARAYASEGAAPNPPSAATGMPPVLTSPPVSAETTPAGPAAS